MAGLLNRLTGGERRSIGQAREVAQLILEQHLPLDEIYAGMLWDDPIMRSRAAHVFCTVTEHEPTWVQPYLNGLLNEVAPTPQWEVREQICKILPKLQLDADAIDQCVRLFQSYLEDRSGIVRTFAMQGLFDLAGHDPELVPMVRGIVENLTLTGTPAMRARGRKLIKQLTRLYGDKPQ